MLLKGYPLNITTILGSPRKKGNTSRVLGWVEDSLGTSGHDIRRINIVDHKIKGCKGCFACKRFTDKVGCSQKDEAVDLLQSLPTSDVVLYATPNYFWGFTGQLKTFIDRHCSLVVGFGTDQWQSLMDGKTVGLIITCEDAIENNTDLMENFFKRFADYLKCKHGGSLTIPFTTTPDALSDSVKIQAIEYARQISFNG